MNNDIVCKACGLFQCEPVIKRNGGHMTAYCAGCGKYIQHVRQSRPAFRFGKYKGRLIDDIVRSDPGYIRWFLQQDIKPGFRKNLEDALSGIEVQR